MSFKTDSVVQFADAMNAIGRAVWTARLGEASVDGSLCRIEFHLHLNGDEREAARRIAREASRVARLAVRVSCRVHVWRDRFEEFEVASGGAS